MKKKRRIIFGVLGVLVVVYIVSTVIPNARHLSELKKTMKTLQSLSGGKIETAVESYVRDRKASNSVVSATVPLRDMISGGYLGAEDMRGLEGREVAVSLTTNGMSADGILIRVRSADGDIVLLGDGSAQLLAR